MSDGIPTSVVDRTEYETGKRRGPGRREQRRRLEKRHRRRRTTLYVLLGWILVGALISAGLVFLQREVSRRRAGGPGEEAPPSQETWLLIGTEEADLSGDAWWLAVMSWAPEERQGFYMYIPPTTNVEIPGFGLEVVGKSRALGGEPLLASTVSNLLGVGFDHHLRISDQALRALFDAAGGLDLDVSSRLTREEDDRIQTVFSEGPQHLDGRRVAEYLGFIGPEGDELSRALRHAEVWSTFLEGHAEDPGALGDLLAANAELFVTDAGSESLNSFFTALAAASPDGFTYETLPVKAVGVEASSQFYAPDRRAIESVVQRHLSGSRPVGAGERGRRVQILNGNGVPGIGQRVAADLVPKGFRIVLNSNANHFDHRVTRVVVYSGSEGALAVGEEIRRILGVGEIVISLQRQGLVDVTIVVGADYPERGD